MSTGEVGTDPRRAGDAGGDSAPASAEIDGGGRPGRVSGLVPSGAALWALVIEAVNLVTSALTFLALVPFLDPVEYGQLGAVLATVAVIGPIATFGAGALLIKRAANEVRWERDFGSAVSVTAIGTVGCGALVVLAQPLLLPGIPLAALTCLVAGQLVLFWLAEIPIWLTVALGRLQLGAGLRVAGAATRIASVAVFIAIGAGSLTAWAVVSLVGAAAGVLAVHGLVRARLGAGWVLVRPPLREFRQGLPFALGQTTEGFLEASDRPLLLRYGHDVGAGYYAVGTRLVGLGYVPLMAIIRSNDRRLFRAGSGGVGPAYRTGRMVAAQAFAVSAVVSVVLFTAAPLLVALLPGAYRETGDVVRLLAVLPMVKAVQFALGNALTASGYQVARLKLTIVAALLNLGLNLVLIPDGGWQAAAMTTIAAETFLMLGAWAVARIGARRQSRADGR